MATVTSTTLSSALETLSAQLDNYRVDPAHARGALRDAALAAARAVAALKRQERQHPALAQVQELAQGMWSAGYHSETVPAEDIAEWHALVTRGWPGVLGSMLCVPCWQWGTAPKLDDVPDWLWSHYITWVFVAPCAATASGAADAHLQKLEALAESVDRLAAANLGAASVQGAVDTFLKLRHVTSPLRSTLSLRRWMTASASVFSRRVRATRTRGNTALALPRDGRRLKVGVVARDWSESIVARTRLPWFSGLDPQAFQVIFFVERTVGGALETECRRIGGKLQLFGAKAEDRVEQLRNSELDVLVLTGRLSSTADMYLGSHRMAPLQVATEECAWASGLPEIDMHLTGNPNAGSEFNGAAAMLGGAGFAWEGENAPDFAQSGPSRAELGLPATGKVMVAAAELEQLSPETLGAWATLLRAQPDTSLLLLPPAGTDTFVLEQVINRLQSAKGFDPRQIIVSLGDARMGFAHADVYLDTFPYSSPGSVLAALHAGLPVVGWEGRTNRANASARLLREFGQEDWVASDAIGYVQRVHRLLTDEDVRNSVVDGIRNHLTESSTDAVLAGSRLGALLGHAFDQVAAGERLPAVIAAPHSLQSHDELERGVAAALLNEDAGAAARHAIDWLRADPRSAEARAQLGRASMLAGNWAFAERCAYSALRGHEEDAQRWLQLAAVLRAKRDFPGAITAYETALRLDARCIDGWIALSEIARQSGANDLAEDAMGVARRIDPRNARLVALAD